eukprot:SAG31_NODE_721_length_12587_cov_5.502002_11_plen_91_part_00
MASGAPEVGVDMTVIYVLLGLVGLPMLLLCCRFLCTPNKDDVAGAQRPAMRPALCPTFPRRNSAEQLAPKVPWPPAHVKTVPARLRSCSI